MTIFPLYCDACGDEIEKVEDGWVEWTYDRGPMGREGYGLRLVHHARCNYQGRAVGDDHLRTFLGVDGMVRLFAIRESYNLPFAEVELMIMRLNVPGYQMASAYVKQMVSAGEFEEYRNPRYLSTGDARAVSAWAKENCY